MFVQLLCTAVLLAFIGVLLSVSAAPGFECLPLSLSHSVSPKLCTLPLRITLIISVVIEGR
jgi:hypothetical protein